MNTFFFLFSRQKYRRAAKTETWLKEAETSVSELSLRRGQRVLARHLFRKTREIHRRFSSFYAPYAKQVSWLEQKGTGATPPETLLLATRWLLKKHASVAAEFRSLETSLAQTSFDEIAPANLIEAGLLLDQYVEQTAFRFSEETLATTLNDWQERAELPLSLSETEALSPLLRLLSLDKLSGVAIRLAEAEEARAKAQTLFGKFGPNSPRYESLLERFRKNRGHLYANAFANAFAESLAKEVQPLSRFRESGAKGRAGTLPGTRNTPQTPEAESMEELATRVRILLRSLSLLGEFEWNTLLKKTNTLHKLLIRDPAEVYAEMTLLSQEVYRKKAASLAKTLHLSEETLARAALALAEDAQESPGNHIGFYLVDDGLPTLLKRLTGSSHLSWWHWYHDREKLPVVQKAYFGIILVLSLTTAGLLTLFSLRYHLLILVVFPIIYKVTKHLTDSFFVGIVPPTFLPRIHFRRRVPESVSAVFVIPALLKDRNTLSALLGKLETAYLSNAKSALSYFLLLDYTDADRETLPEDAALLAETSAAFRTLNDRYGETDRFAFLLRSRVWSAQQERWMGWERKRGKLLDFARILRGRTPSSPFLCSAETIPRADFVITLDEDAFITRDFIKDLLGIHAHPLQKPLLQHGKLVHGYTFIQPHVKQWFKNRHRFRLPRIFFDEKRFSAYSSIFPEVYQDVFLEGSYAGKGSFHVESFLAALDGTLPTDQILSHDLLEGSLARTAYAADIDVFDEFPKSLRAMLARNHRWTRGDWQIIDWLFTNVRDEHATLRANVLSGVHKFKIADNLLQSLFRPTVFLITILSWIAGNSSLLLFVWGLFLLDLVALDVCIDWTRWIFQALTGQWKHLAYRFQRTTTRSFRLLRQAAFECSILPYSALDTLQAIGIALFRRFWSKKNMLEWVASSHFENPVGREPLLFPLLVLLIVSLSLWFEREIHPLFALLLALWMAIPLLVFALNRPYRNAHSFSHREQELLRRDALETWSFFANTVIPETNFLPPDYVRSGPSAVIAGYTSITNIGFFLLSVITAHRFGFISLKKARTYLENTCHTLGRLEQYAGHFYNWYNIQTALPAAPPFISSVDSGNLLASLIVVRQWLSRDMKSTAIARATHGLLDIAHLVRTRIPRTLDTQSFTDFWEALVERVGALSPESDPDVFFEQCAAIKTSLAGMIIPKSLSPEARNILTLFHERLADAIIEQQERIFHASSETTGNASENTALEKRLDAMIAAMRFDFLRSNKRALLSIGFHVPTKRLETRFYQTLASEARIANLLALAEGTLSFRGWNKLNRTVLALPAGPALVSWTGTLFEYLMPAIFLEEHEDSLVGRSIRTAIDTNRRFSKKNHLPVWGLSESGYAELDRGGNFRYKPFGLPSLSLSPSVDDRPVVSAYGIVMSISSFPRAALKNLAAYAAHGGKGVYGYIEAIDFHRSRHGSPVNMYMSHHQGMILSALGNALFDRFLSRLFESHPLVQNSLFVLDESLPPIDKEPFPRPATPYLQSTLVHPRTP